MVWLHKDSKYFVMVPWLIYGFLLIIMFSIGATSYFVGYMQGVRDAREVVPVPVETTVEEPRKVGEPAPLPPTDALGLKGNK